MRHLLTFSMRATRRLSGFAVSVVVLAVASLVLMPATIGAAGLETWSSIVLGQALALIVQTVAGCGYGVNGPAIIATRTLGEAASYFRVAQRTRFFVAVPCFALMVGAMFVIPNPDPVVGLLGGAHLAIGSFTALFFYIGRASPLWLLWTETTPRAALMFAGAISLHLGAPLMIGLALPVLGAVLGVVISTVSILISARRTYSYEQSLNVSSVSSELRIQVGPIAASLLRGGRDALPVLIVTAVAADLVGAFGVFERIQRQIVGSLAPVISTLQGWVPRRIAVETSARPAVAALLASLAGAPLILLLFVWLGSPLISWLSAGEIQPTSAENLLCGALIATSMLAQVIAYACLVPLGGIADVIWSSVVGVIGILIAIPVMSALQQSVTYMLGALVIVNVVQIIIQLLLMRRSASKGLFLMAVESETNG